MKKIFILLIIFSVSYQFSYAQGRKVYEKAAMDAVAAEDYASALGYYEILLEEAGYESVEGYYQAGEAAYNFRLFNRSERYFQWAIDNGGLDAYPKLDYQMGLTKKRLGKYAEAKTSFEKYRAANASSGGALLDKAADQIIACDWAMNLVENPVVDVHSPFPVVDSTFIEHLDSTVNTPYPDMAPLFRNDKLYYSSIQDFAGKDIGPIARILSSENGAMATPESGLGGVETSVAHTTFSQDKNRIYFTICDTIKGNRYQCEIHYRERDGEGWGKAERLPKRINKKGTTATQPSIGYDEASGEELMFFASDREGGMGGMDIWCSIIKKGKVGAPFNVGAVNTAGDDVTPYFHGRKNTLYFSSNGRKSMGGFDIYKSKREGETWSLASHTGYPLNGGYDDIYPSLNEKGDRLYFSSNRPGGFCEETYSEECICDDIYVAEVPYVDLIVETYNSITKEELTGTVVTLNTMNVKTSDAIQGPNEAAFKFLYDLDFNHEYGVTGTKTDYTEDGTEFSTFDMESGTIIKKLYLTPQIDVLADTYDRVTGAPLNGVTVELVAAPTIATLDSKTHLDNNHYEYGLEFKQRYLLIASKSGYVSDTVEVFTDNIPIVPTTLERELRLCKKPFDENPQIVLYFDNDIPKKRRNNHSQTNSNYRETYEGYSSDNKQKEYINAFSTEEEKDRVRNFFYEVNNNFTKLEAFAASLHGYISTPSITDTVVITIKGYASPLAKPAYNKLLTERRIYSVEEYLREYKGGIMTPYMSRVRVEREPYGEETAKGGSEDRKNKKASIYSIDASQERRVEIIKISGIKQECPPKKK